MQRIPESERCAADGADEPEGDAPRQAALAERPRHQHRHEHHPDRRRRVADQRAIDRQTAQHHHRDDTHDDHGRPGHRLQHQPADGGEEHRHATPALRVDAVRRRQHVCDDEVDGGQRQQTEGSDGRRARVARFVGHGGRSRTGVWSPSRCCETLSSTTASALACRPNGVRTPSKRKVSTTERCSVYPGRPPAAGARAAAPRSATGARQPAI